jgi:4-coumarate--CoA ligase
MLNRAVKVCMFPLSRGLGTVILQGFDPVSFGKSIEQYKLTFSAIVPPVLVQIANNPVFEQFDFSSMRGFLSGE